MGFARKVKEARKQAGLTQLELAEAVGVSKNMIQRYESGETGTPRMSTLRSLAAATNRTVDFFLDQSAVQVEELRARVAAAEARALESKERELEARERLLELERLLSLVANSQIKEFREEKAQESLTKLIQMWQRQKKFYGEEF